MDICIVVLTDEHPLVAVGVEVEVAVHANASHTSSVIYLVKQLKLLHARENIRQILIEALKFKKRQGESLEKFLGKKSQKKNLISNFFEMS